MGKENVVQIQNGIAHSCTKRKCIELEIMNMNETNQTGKKKNWVLSPLRRN